MRTIQIEAGIVYGGGKVIPWKIFHDTLNGAADEKTTKKISKKLNDLITFMPILINQKTNNKEIADIVGIKYIDNEEKLKKAIFKKIEKLNATYFLNLESTENISDHN